MASLSPFGQSGPDAHAPAYDIAVCAAAGITYSVGMPGCELLTPLLFLSAYQAGMGTAAATMTALLARRMTGFGQQVGVSLLEIFANIHSCGTALTFLSLRETGRLQANRRPDLYPYVILPCQDGYVCLIARERHQWRRFLAVLGNPAWVAGGLRGDGCPLASGAYAPGKSPSLHGPARSLFLPGVKISRWRWLGELLGLSDAEVSHLQSVGGLV
jgi:crotonobetainyl-CoA:carnitine CoA-transferase CaiB-like acyl-CoA transferase